MLDAGPFGVCGRRFQFQGQKRLLKMPGSHGDVRLHPKAEGSVLMTVSALKPVLLLSEPGPHLGQAGGQHAVGGRRRPHHHHGPARLADPGQRREERGRSSCKPLPLLSKPVSLIGVLRHRRGQPVRRTRRAAVDQGEHPRVEELHHRVSRRRRSQAVSQDSEFPSWA